VLGLLTLLCILLYLSATGLISSRLFHQDGPNSKLAHNLAIVALVLHSVVLYNDILATSGQNLSITNVASVIALLMALTMTIVTTAQTNVYLIPVVYGFSGLVVTMNAVIPATYLMHIELQPGLLIHIGLALFAYGTLMIALLFAFQLNYINKRLKLKKVSILHSSLPPLMGVENTLFRILMAGTILLSFSLLSGFVFLEDMFAQKQVHKTVFSIVSWCIFVGILFAHRQFGWRGQKVVVSTIVGTVFLTLAYFGSRIVKEIILQ